MNLGLPPREIHRERKLTHDFDDLFQTASVADKQARLEEYEGNGLFFPDEREDYVAEMLMSTLT